MTQKNKELIAIILILLFILAGYIIYIFSFIWCIIHKVNWYYLVLLSLICISVLYFFTKGWIDGLRGWIKRYKK